MNHRDVFSNQNTQERTEASEYHEEVWNRFRDYSPTDLSTFKQTISDRRELLFKQYEYAKERGDEGEMDYWEKQYHRTLIMSNALNDLYNYHLRQGEYPPAYNEDSQRKARDPVSFSDLPFRTQEFFNLAASISGITDANSLDFILREVAEKADFTYSTVYKWMCERKP